MLELLEMSRGKGACLFSDRGDIGSSVIQPKLGRRLTLGEEQDIGLRPRSVGGKRAARTPEHGVDIAVLHQDLEDLSCPISKEHIIWYYHRSTAGCFEQRENVLEEIQLLVRGLYNEILTSRDLVSPFRPKGWVSNDDVISLPGRSLVDGVPERNMGLHLVEVEVHQR